MWRTAAGWSLVLLVAGCAEARRLDVAAGLSAARPLTPGADLVEQPAGLVVIQGRVKALRSSPRWVDFELVEPVEPGPGEARGGAAVTPVRVAIPLIGPEAAMLAARWSGHEVRVVGTVDGLASPPALLVDGPPRVSVLDGPEVAAIGTGVAPTQERAAESGGPLDSPVSPGVQTGAARTESTRPPAEPLSAAPGAPLPMPSAVRTGDGAAVVGHAGLSGARPAAVAADAPEQIVVHAGGEPGPTPTAVAGPSAECRAARETRLRAAAAARIASDRLARCLGTEASCRDEIAAARDPLAAVAAAEERVSWLCPEAP